MVRCSFAKDSHSVPKLNLKLPRHIEGENSTETAPKQATERTTSEYELLLLLTVHYKILWHILLLVFPVCNHNSKINYSLYKISKITISCTPDREIRYFSLGDKFF